MTAPDEFVTPRRREPWWTIALFVIGVVVVLALSVSAIVHVPYAVLRPGPVSNVLGDNAAGKPMISVSGEQTYPTEGTLDLLTVSVSGGPGHELTALDYLAARLDPNAAIYPQDEIFPPGATEQDVSAENTAEMVDSQQEAIAVALRALGKKVTQVIVVAGVGDNSPATSAGIQTGDEIVAIAGTKTSSAKAIQDAMAAQKPGVPVEVTVLRGKDRKVLTATPSDVDGKATLGVYLGIRFDFPFTVTIDAGSVGGPSAGLMFTLGVYDLLTPGALTSGVEIAGTGTMNDRGQVGAIGGIRQKLIGARDGGARWFLAPADNCSEVVGHVPSGLTVVKVSTFDEALKAVQNIAVGGTSQLPSCTG